MNYIVKRWGIFERMLTRKKVDKMLTRKKVTKHILHGGMLSCEKLVLGMLKKGINFFLERTLSNEQNTATWFEE